MFVTFVLNMLHILFYCFFCWLCEQVNICWRRNISAKISSITFDYKRLRVYHCLNTTEQNDRFWYKMEYAPTVWCCITRRLTCRCSLSKGVLFPRVCNLSKNKILRVSSTILNRHTKEVNVKCSVKNVRNIYTRVLYKIYSSIKIFISSLSINLHAV